MTSRPRRLLGALLAGVLGAGLVVAGTTTPASAITGGRDDTENEFPNVGLIAFYDDAGDRYRCSATLVTPTVLVTAAHCTDGTQGKTAVTFEPYLAEKGPSPLPGAADPKVGYTADDINAVPGYHAGTAHTHPDYSDFTDIKEWNDLGVIVLDSPLPTVATTAIAPLDTLTKIPQRRFNKTLFTMVGYGTEVRQPDTGPQKPVPMSYPLRRQIAESPGQKLDVQVFQVQGNPNDNRGTGGTCFGDSGGPALLNGQIVGVTSYGYTSNCRYLGGYQRLDIAASQDWLATFEVFPAAK